MSREKHQNKEIVILKEESEKLKNKIIELENTIKEQNSMLIAQEKVNKLSTNERLFAEATIKAYEKAIDLSQEELNNAKKTVRTKELIKEHLEKTQTFNEETINALIRVLDLSKSELDEAYKTIEAYENVSELARQEAFNLLEEIKNLKLSTNKD